MFIPEKNSALFADSFDGSLFLEEENTILKRFAKVFEQAYTRFLDLQKAEAQAREAQYELRIRKSSCKNHGDAEKSDELQRCFNLSNKIIRSSNGSCGFNIW